MVSMWFKHETGLIMMIEILIMMREELDKADFSVDGARVQTNLETSPQQKPLAQS